MIHEYEYEIVPFPQLEITRAIELQDQARRELAIEQRRSEEMLGGWCLIASIVIVAGAFVWAVWL